jgi:hypothetical protein
MKAMSDYMAAQKNILFGYDADLEIVTPGHQKLMLANSGTVNLSRPDKMRATRDGGFSSVEMIFDGKMLTLVNKDAKTYAQTDEPGTLDHLIDDLRDKFHEPVPGADLLMSNIYDQLMPNVIDTKYPCRYVITSNKIDRGPQCSVHVRDWKTGGEAAAGDFAFVNPTNAKKIDAVDLGDVDELPSQIKGVT